MGSSGAYGGPLPTIFDAVTRKLYGVLAFRPGTSMNVTSPEVVPT